MQQGSLYPALHRLERRGWIKAKWRASENNRRAKYYELTRKGRAQLEAQADGVARLTVAVGQILDMSYEATEERCWTTCDTACARSSVAARVERELDDELRFHLEHHINAEESPASARGGRAAGAADVRRRRPREGGEPRRARRVADRNAWRDLRYAVRLLARSPASPSSRSSRSRSASAPTPRCSSC